MLATMKAKKAMKGKSSVRKVKAKKTRKAMKAMKARTGKTSMKVMKAMHVHDGCEDLARHAVSDEDSITEDYPGYREDLARPPEDEFVWNPLAERDDYHEGHEGHGGLPANIPDDYHEGHEGHGGLPANIPAEMSDVSSEDRRTPTDRDFGSKRKRVNCSFHRRSRPTRRQLSTTPSEVSEAS